MRLVIEPMQIDDIGEVLEVDRESYTSPWPASAYRREIMHNRSAHYIVLRHQLESGDGRPHSGNPKSRLPFFRWTSRASEPSTARGRILGYAGMWMMVDEAHVTTVAVRSAYRGRGFGELLLASLIEAGIDRNARRITLEVRVSNATAQRLYRKYGFEEQGVRTRYYSDNNEDAYIMTTHDVLTPEYREDFAVLVENLRVRLERGADIRVSSPADNNSGAVHPLSGMGPIDPAHE